MFEEIPHGKRMWERTGGKGSFLEETGKGTLEEELGVEGLLSPAKP
jgi:hypothetical protein